MGAIGVLKRREKLSKAVGLVISVVRQRMWVVGMMDSSVSWGRKR
jgi:hypothetical protein